MRYAAIADTSCIRPAGFNLAEYWQQSMTQFQANLPRYALTVRVDPQVMPRLRYAGHFARIEQIDLPDADGWIPVSIRFDLEEEACAYVLGFGAHMEVVEPPELRDSSREKSVCVREASRREAWCGSSKAQIASWNSLLGRSPFILNSEVVC